MAMSPGQPNPHSELFAVRAKKPSNDLRLLSSIRRQSPSTAVVLMTAHGTREIAAEALALGAYEVMAKPFDVERLESMLCKAHEAATN